MYIIRAKMTNYLRPCYLNENYAGSGWSRKATARRFASKEAAEQYIAAVGLKVEGTIDVEEVTK